MAPQHQQGSLTLVCMAPILRASLLPLARPRATLGPSLPSDLSHHGPPASRSKLDRVWGEGPGSQSQPSHVSSPSSSSAP